MPAKHTIDHEKELIITTWEGEATDSLLKEAFENYHRFLLSEPEILNYHEILDVSGLDPRHVTNEGLIQLAQVAVNIDLDRPKLTRAAIVVSSMLAFGLARMYEIYRSLSSDGKKELRIFRTREEADEWLAGATLPD